MSEPIVPVRIDNIFTPEEYSAIYDHVNDVMAKGERDHNDKYYYMTKLTNNGFVAILDPSGFPSIVQEKLQKISAQLIDSPSGVGFLWARYTLDSGDVPTLMPHCDKSEKFVGLYGTVQLNSNIDWDFYVEEEKFEMKNNSSVWFTGTHQIHWRPDKKFNTNDYYDILLAQTHSSLDTNPLPEEHYVTMDHKALDFANRYKDTLLKNGFAKNYFEDGCQ